MAREQPGSFSFSGMRCSQPVVQVISDVFYINGQADAGYTVKATIRNEGNAGFAVLLAQLSSSEGTFVRQRDFYFAAGSTQEIVFQFHEPTINAYNVQAIVRCAPR